MEKGKALHEAGPKLKSLSALLHRKGLIERASLKGLADGLGLKVSRLQYVVDNRVVAVAVESALCRLAGFDPEHPSWIDLSVTEADRATLAPGQYSGRDTADAFHAHLLSCLFPVASSRERRRSRATAIDRMLASHMIDLIPGNESGETAIAVQADFGVRYDDSGICYGIRQAHLELTINCTRCRAVARIGRPKPYRFEDADLIARGTDLAPGWDIVASNDDGQILHGPYEIRDPALAIFQHYSDQTEIVSRMRVNLHNMGIVSDTLPKPASGARRAVLDALFAMDFAEGGHENGWITLSEHALAASEQC